MCGKTHSYVRHDSLICVTWLTHMCDMTHSYVRHDSFISETWLIRMCKKTRWCVIRHIHIWDMTHSYVRHDSLLCVTWLTHMWDMTHSYVWHDSLICVTWLTHMCEMTHLFMRHDSFPFVTWLVRGNIFLQHCDLLETCDFMHSYGNGIQLVGSIKSYVSFAKEPYKRDHILQKKTCNLIDPTNHIHPISKVGLSHMCDMTHSYVWHDWFMCDMTHSHV